MKRIISWMLCFALILQCTVFASAAEPVKFTLGSTTVKAGQEISIPLSIDSSENINTIGVTGFTYDENVLTFKGFTEYSALITASAFGAGGVDNAKKTITLGYMQSSKISGKLCCLTFTVAENATPGDYTISYTGVAKQSSTVKETQCMSATVTVVREVSNVAIEGALTTPVKKTTDQTDLSGDNVNVAVAWSPALIDNAFAMKTAYTATVTVTPANGVVFSENAAVTMNGLTFTRSDDTFVATKTFPATAGKDAQTISAENVTAVYGDTNKFVSATTTGDGVISYAVTAGTDVVSVDETKGTLTILKAGTATVTITAAATEDCLVATKNITITVSKATVTTSVAPTVSAATADSITVNTVAGQVYGIAKGDNFPTQFQSNGTFTDLEANTTYKVFAKILETENYLESALSQPCTVTTDKLEQVITAENLSVAPNSQKSLSECCTTNAADNTLVYTLVGTLPAGTSFDEKAGTISTGKVEGSFSVRISATAYGDYKAAEDKTITITVRPLEVQSFAAGFDTAVTKTYGDEIFAKVATLTAGNGTITYQSSDESVATVDANGKVTILKAGSAIITATAAETSTHAAASVSYPLAVEKKPITIMMQDASKVYGEKNPSFTWVLATDNSLVGSDTATCITVAPSCVATEATDVGTVAITANATADNYDVTVTNGKLTITKKTLTVVAGDLVITKVYDGTTATGSAKENTRLALEGVVNNDAISVTYTTVGAYSGAGVSNQQNIAISGINLTGAKAGNYSVNTSATLAIGEITKATPTAKHLTVSDIAKVYNGQEQKPTAICKSDYTGMGEITVTSALTNAGITAIAVSVAEGANFTAATIATGLGNFTVTPKTISGVTVEGIESNGYEFTNNEVKPALTVKDGDTTLTENTDYTLTYSNHINVGTATITITGTGNYHETKQVTFQITKTQPKKGTDYTVTLPTDLTYSGTAKEVAVVKSNAAIGNITVFYALKTEKASYNLATTATPKTVGTYKVTVNVAGSDNYAAMTDVNCGEFTITPAPISIASVTVKDKVYNNKTDDAVVTAISFTGIQNGERLTEGVDYTVTAAYTNANASDTAAVTGTVTLVEPTNYELADGSYQTTGKVEKVTTTLALTAADAVYTGVAYEESNITATATQGVTYTYYSDTTCTTSVTPVNAGEYWVKGTIAETTNYTAAEAIASFTISKAPLTVTAVNKTVTYGGAAPSYTVVTNGFVNSETVVNLTGALSYDCTYVPGGDVGTYEITPKGYTSDNYELTFVDGTLTVEQLEATITWTESDFFFDKSAKSVTATVSNKFGTDDVAVMVTNGTKTAIGNYTATATSLVGERVGNYKLPTDNLNRNFAIKPALTSVAVNLTTITAVIDTENLTVKLVGYMDESESYTLNDLAVTDGKITANGVEYTVDATGIQTLPATVTVEEAKKDIPTFDQISQSAQEAGVTSVLLSTISAPETKVEGLNSAIVNEVMDADTNMPEGATKVEVQISMKLEPTAYTPGSALTLNITPTITLAYKNDNGENKGSKSEELHILAVPVTISVKLPDTMPTENLWAKHDLGGGLFEYLMVTVTDGVASWQQCTFSDVELLQDTRSATIQYGEENTTYTPANVGAQLPTATKPSHTFNGWKLTDGMNDYGTHKTLTDALLSNIDGKTITATAQFTNNTPPTPYTPSEPSTPVEEPVTTPEMSFSDVSKDAWYYEVIAQMYQKGMMQGVSEDSFAPAEKATRGMIWIMLGRMSGEKLNTSGKDWYVESQTWAMTNGLTDGTVPENYVTREQIATMLYRDAQRKGKGFTGNWMFLLNHPDAEDISSWAEEAMHWCVMNGIITGDDKGMLNPTAPATRAEIAAMFARYLEQ